MTEPSHRRKWMLQMQQPVPRATVFDRVAFLIGAAAAVWLAVIIAIQGVRTPWALAWLIPIWAITAYLVLPRLHRLLSDLYVPDYFFGRTRTADGLLGDPVNLGIDGTAAQLDEAMSAAGWHHADEITAASTWRIITSTITRRSYPTAPVSSLMLFGRRHDVAYQQEVEGNPKQRHHVRFWHSPPGWLLPGGAHADWLGAATYDTDVGISFFTLQITHRIDENTDIERDHVVSSVTEANPGVKVRVLRDFTTGYHSRNGGGDRFETDGDLPIIDVNGITPRAPLDISAPVPAIARVPLTVAVAVALVVLVAVVQLIEVLTDDDLWRTLAEADAAEMSLLLGVLAVFGLFAIGELIMAGMVLARGRRSRAVLILLVTVSIVFMAVDYMDGTTVLGLDSALLGASVQCITLLCLSSDSAGAWARRAARTAAPEVGAPKISG
ncbi:LssY C-terminal domain-containing protein [Microbacterium paludicola]|uniref:LssY C-terminal domain-containing protein n=1 Tax=Microbacterium paludicola TaxID=300019 RepID=UPI0021B5105B|nr:LssY C-terminal domain-containing protein [Microbacterium paludicola]